MDTPQDGNVGLQTAGGNEAHLREELDKVTKEFRDFAYIISHDLKAPLRGIKVLSEWLVSDYAEKFDQDGKEQLGLLVARVDRLQSMIDGALQYSRIGRQEAKPTQTDLNALVREAVEMLSPPAGVSITVQSDLPLIATQASRIRQVFENLIGNAVKFMDKPQGQVSISCVEDGDYWKFSVADNGAGIDEKDFERIFKIFQKLAPQTDSGSVGVGLTIAKKIVETLGGKIWLESEVGRGATFFFTLPKQAAAIEAEKPAVVTA